MGAFYRKMDSKVATALKSESKYKNKGNINKRIKQ